MKATTKAKAKVSPASKDATKSKAVEIVKVPAALTEAISVYASATTAKLAAGIKQEQTLVKTAEVVSKLFKTKEDAAPVLKQAFADAGLTSLVDSSQRSRILAQAFPSDPVVYNQAKTAPITFLNTKGEKVTKAANTNQLTAIATGKLKPNKKGVWLPVQSAGTQGGHNAKTPLDTMKTAIDNAITAFVTVAKGDWQAVLNTTIAALKACDAFDEKEAKRLCESGD